MCTLQVGYPAESEGAPFQSLDDTKFKIGAELEVKLGATEETVTQTLFKGEIVTVEPEFHSGSVAMVVRAYDRTHRMMRTRKQRDVHPDERARTSSRRSAASSASGPR